MTTRLSAFALMFGNIAVGVAVLAPAGMLSDLAAGLVVSIKDAGLLVAYGAIILCFGSPLMAWVTSNVDRRRLLAATLAILAVGQVASAFAPDYVVLLALRLLMLAVAAIYTPQAASTIAMIVPERDRPSAISFVFLGWSLSIAVALPLVTFLSADLGWRATYAVLGAAAALGFALIVVGLPAGLRGVPLSIASFAVIARNRTVVLLLLVTLFWTAAMFVIFPYLGPLLARLAGAGATTSGAFFALYGVMGFAGNVIATRVVKQFGAVQYIGRRSRHDVRRYPGLVARRRNADADGGRHADAWAGICRYQLDATGAPGGGGARPCRAPPLHSTRRGSTPARRWARGWAGVLDAHDQLLANGYMAAAFMLGALVTLRLTRFSNR